MSSLAADQYGPLPSGKSLHCFVWMNRHVFLRANSQLHNYAFSRNSTQSTTRFHTHAKHNQLVLNISRITLKPTEGSLCCDCGLGSAPAREGSLPHESSAARSNGVYALLIIMIGCKECVDFDIERTKICQLTLSSFLPMICETIWRDWRL